MPERQDKGGRELKRTVLELLGAVNFEDSLEKLLDRPGRQVINPLFSFLMHSDPRIRWRSVAAMGAVMDALVTSDLEGARTIMRRLMWSLNDESGGIGWGAPEAMGEAMARNRVLAGEYASILVSFADEGGNFLEYGALQQGLIWAFRRMAGTHPDLIRPVGPHLIKYLASSDPVIRGLAAWTAGLLGLAEAAPKLEVMVGDDSHFDTFIDCRPVRLVVGDLAGQALGKIETFWQTADDSH